MLIHANFLGWVEHKSRKRSWVFHNAVKVILWQSKGQSKDPQKVTSKVEYLTIVVQESSLETWKNFISWPDVGAIQTRVIGRENIVNLSLSIPCKLITNVECFRQVTRRVLFQIRALVSPEKRCVAPEILVGPSKISGYALETQRLWVSNL